MLDAHALQVPSCQDLREAPQRGPLAALTLALTLAESSLLTTHSAVRYRSTAPEVPTVELARLLATRAAELRGLIPAYLALLRPPAGELEDDPF